MRADFFVKNHIEAVESQLTLAFSKSIKQNKDKNENENEKKNQKAPIKNRRKTDIISHKKEPTMQSKDRNKSSILNPQPRTHINQHVPLLPNGSELQRRNKSIVLTNTCGFDSIASIYGAMYIDDSIIRSVIDNSSSKFAAFIKLLFQQKKIPTIEYARYEFMKEIFPDQNAVKELSDLTSFNCATGISDLFSSMCMNNADVLSSRKRMAKCSKCGDQQLSELPFVNYDIANFDFKNVQQSIVAEKDRVCNACLKKPVAIEDEFNEMVVIDCELLSKSNELTSIKDIQNQINLKGDEYELFATIEYDPQLKHFIPHIKRKSNDWETHDDLSHMKSDTDINEEMFIFMLFYKKKSNGMYLI